MTAVLVSLAEMQRFLGDPPSEDSDAIQEILNHVEDLFLKACGRHDRPFLATADTTARTEVKDGTGTRYLFLDYPISDLSTDITLGIDTSDLIETLEYDDVDSVVWVAGKRMIERTDGSVWGCYSTPRYVRVTYKAAADMPETPKLALKRATALIYRQRGTEDASRYSLSGYSQDQAKFGREFVDDDPIWLMAVNATREPRLS